MLNQKFLKLDNLEKKLRKKRDMVMIMDLNSRLLSKKVKSDTFRIQRKGMMKCYSKSIKLLLNDINRNP